MGFSLVNQPFLGDPPWLWKPPYMLLCSPHLDEASSSYPAPPRLQGLEEGGILPAMSHFLGTVSSVWKNQGFGISPTWKHEKRKRKNDLRNEIVQLERHGKQLGILNLLVLNPFQAQERRINLSRSLRASLCFHLPLIVASVRKSCWNSPGRKQSKQQNQATELLKFGLKQEYKHALTLSYSVSSYIVWCNNIVQPTVQYSTVQQYKQTCPKWMMSAQPGGFPGFAKVLKLQIQ